VGIHPATLQRCVTQSVTGGIPTQSVGTMIAMYNLLGVFKRYTKSVKQ
jgi:hypothetical protein